MPLAVLAEKNTHNEFWNLACSCLACQIKTVASIVVVTCQLRSAQTLFALSGKSQHDILRMNFDVTVAGGTSTQTGSAILTAWGRNAHTCLHALALPRPLAALVSHGLWHDIVLTSKWHVKPKLFATFPSSISRAEVSDIVTHHVPSLAPGKTHRYIMDAKYISVRLDAG